MKEFLKYCKELSDYEFKFGNFSFCNLDDNLSYYNKKNDKYFLIPDSIKTETLENLYKKSLEDNKDYVLETAIKENWKILDYTIEDDEEV